MLATRARPRTVQPREYRERPKTLVMHDCESTLIARYGYDAEALELHVDFHDGSQWKYRGVTGERFEAFLQAPSKGKHLRALIVGKHDAEKLS